MTDNTQTNLTLKYTAPKVVVYGGMAALTAGGTGSVTEAQAGNKSKTNRA